MDNQRLDYLTPKQYKIAIGLANTEIDSWTLEDKECYILCRLVEEYGIRLMGVTE